MRPFEEEPTDPSISMTRLTQEPVIKQQEDEAYPELTGEAAAVFGEVRKIVEAHQDKLTDDYAEGNIASLKEACENFNTLVVKLKTGEQVRGEELVGVIAKIKEINTAISEDNETVKESTAEAASALKQRELSTLKTEWHDRIANDSLSSRIAAGEGDKMRELFLGDDVYEGGKTFLECISEDQTILLHHFDVLRALRHGLATGLVLYEQTRYLKQTQATLNHAREIVAKNTNIAYGREGLRKSDFYAVRQYLNKPDVMDRLVDRIVAGNEPDYDENELKEYGFDLSQVREYVTQRGGSVDPKEIKAQIREAALKLQEPWEAKFNVLDEGGIMKWF